MTTTDLPEHPAADPGVGLVGQPRAVEALRRAAARPVHAYLLVGPRGSGVEEGARALAAVLVDAAGDPRVARGRHPDVVEFRPTANEYSVERDVRGGVLPEIHAAPVEGPRKCVVLLEAERLNDPSANALLKSIEEPPPRTVVVVVTDSADALPITIRSRCQRIDFGGLSDDLVVEALRADGVDEGAARLAAALAGGRLDRARALAGPLAPLRLAFADAPSRVTGYGARVLDLAAGLAAALDDAVAALETVQARDLEEADAEAERLGYTARTAQAMRRRLVEAQKRTLRRARTEALLEGVAAIESIYRDALAPDAPPRNLDRAPLRVGPREAARALDACAATRRSFTFNPTEGLLLEHLLLHLPPVAPA
ncbi:MAG: hypothetical protein ACKO72_04270 [Actinomycetes bacterium]